MYRHLVVALLFVVFAVQAWGQPNADNTRLSVTEGLPVQYQRQSAQDAGDSVTEQIPENATALLPGSRDHDQLIKHYMRLARTHDNNGNLSAARDALERMRRELTYVDDPRSTAA